MKAKAAEERLKKVGLWATILWAVSGLYVVIIVWVAKDYYIQQSNWRTAISQAYADNPLLTFLGLLVVAGWIVCGVAWLGALKANKISRKTGLKDLFLTIRR